MKAGKAQGFALIDLIFVCGIIGLLCSIALPRLLLAKQSAGAASAIGSMRVDQQRAADVRADVRQRLLRAEPDDARHAAARKPRAVHLGRPAAQPTP